MDIPIYNHPASREPSRNSWSSHAGDLGLHEMQAISNLVGVTYSYSGDGKPVSYTATTSFGDRSQNAYRPTTSAQHTSTPWPDGKCVGDANYPLQEQYQRPQSYDDYHYVDGLPSHQFPEAMLAIEYDSTVSSSVPEVQDSIIPVFGSDEPYQAFLTSFPLPSASDDDAVHNPEFSATNHTSLLPNQHSTYSELSANLAYMAALSTSPEDEVPFKRQIGIERRKKEKFTTKVKERQYKRTLEISDDIAGALLSTVDWTRKKMKTVAKGSDSSSANEPSGEARARASAPLSVRSRLVATGRAPPKDIPPPSSIGRGGAFSSDRSSTGKKLGLACLFCRERKIACGRPSESNPDQTCNQCARRLFKCEYPTESRRGQHKRAKSKPDVT